MPEGHTVSSYDDDLRFLVRRLSEMGGIAERMVAELRQCIRLNLDCSYVCLATGALASRRTGSNEALLRRMLEVCAEACRLCGEECGQHVDRHEHCRICSESCLRCERACNEAAATITPTRQ